MNGMTRTFNGVRKHGRVTGNQSSNTWGGYSAVHVVNERFALKIPEGLPLESAAPIMCAGITMYDPLRHWGATTGEKKTIGIIGIGGLGTMGIKLSKALGHDVVAISSTSSKEQMAMDKGATHFVASKDPESIQKCAGICDLILNTVSAQHDLNVYMPLLAKSGTMV